MPAEAGQPESCCACVVTATAASGTSASASAAVRACFNGPCNNSCDCTSNSFDGFTWDMRLSSIE